MVQDLCTLRYIVRDPKRGKVWLNAVKVWFFDWHAHTRPMFFVQESGLGSFLQSVTDPANGLELVHPDVELSFRFHDWRNTYGAILDAFMSTDPCLPEPMQVSLQPLCCCLGTTLALQIDECPLPDDWLKSFEPLFFLKFLSLDADILPWRSNTMAIFLFVSAACFVANWDEWLFACLQMRKFPQVRSPVVDHLYSVLSLL